MRSLRLKAVTFLSIVVFSGCARRASYNTNAPSATTPTSAYAIPARAFLAKDQSPQDGLGAYGYIIFTRRPRPEEKTRYVHVCESYLRTLEPSAAYPEARKESLMVTHWFLTVTQTDIRQPKCDMLVDLYDFARATPIGSSANVLGSEGPVLVAWATSYKNDLPTSTALVLDLSRFDDADLDRAFIIWKEKIVDDPSTWNDGGFKLIKAREAFRNLIQQYGDQIVKVIKTLAPSTKEK